jgi:hypothetical protein
VSGVLRKKLHAKSAGSSRSMKNTVMSAASYIVLHGHYYSSDQAEDKEMWEGHVTSAEK